MVLVTEVPMLEPMMMGMAERTSSTGDGQIDLLALHGPAQDDPIQPSSPSASGPQQPRGHTHTLRRPC